MRVPVRRTWTERVAAAYPGNPSSEIIESLAGVDPARGLYVEWSVNEKVAYEEALGVSFAGKRSLVSFKHVGLNVAADPFMNSAITGANGGFLVVSADDPGMHSSQNEQDSRFYARFARIPCFEPADHQECYDLTREAYTRQLWAFEGFTSYYDDMALRRSGVIDTHSYLELLGRTITSVLRTPGRRRQSAAEASFDAWIKYYRPDDHTPNGTVSYYLKGELVALSLDLALRLIAIGYVLNQRRRGGLIDFVVRVVER